ncbi:MAG: ABC transporter permease [Candidatus Pacearchaeota archaeon]|nr:ABC transporter permease [Candidatus Pacearchaeota archaeon]
MIGLSYTLAKFKFKLRNEGSYLGIIWYLLNPLFFFTLLFLIFKDRMGNEILQYPLYLLVGIIMFNFFQSITSESANAILHNRGLIKSIKFPHESLILSNLIKVLFSHFFEMIILIIFLIISGVNPIFIIFYPIVLLFFCLFIYGISLVLSTVTVYLVDFGNIWGFITSMMWFATPIFYAIGGQTRLFILNFFNPLYYFITLARDIIIYNKIPELWVISGAVMFSLMSLTIGLFMFNKSKRKFAEKI